MADVRFDRATRIYPGTTAPAVYTLELHMFEAAMARLRRPYRIALELGHTEAIKKAVEGGLGVSCLSRLAVQREVTHWWLKAVRTPLDLRRKLLLLTRRERRRTPLFSAFLKLLSDPEGFEMRPQSSRRGGG